MLSILVTNGKIPTLKIFIKQFNIWVEDVNYDDSTVK